MVVAWRREAWVTFCPSRVDLHSVVVTAISFTSSFSEETVLSYFPPTFPQCICIYRLGTFSSSFFSSLLGDVVAIGVKIVQSARRSVRYEYCLDSSDPHPVLFLTWSLI